MKRTLLLTAIVAFAGLNTAQADDFGLWGDLAVQKNITKRFSVDAGIDLRAENELKDFTRIGAGVGLGFKATKWLSFGAGYTFLHDYNLSETKPSYKKDGTTFRGYNVDDAYWRNKHRAAFDVSGAIPVGRFTITVRERYQYTHYVATNTQRTKYRSEITDLDGWTGDVYTICGRHFSSMEQEKDAKGAKDKHYLRSRFGLEYNIRHCAWTPYATYEFSNDLSHQLHLDKQRLTVGAEWKITKQHRLDLAYVYSNGADDDNNSDCHALSIGYKFKF